LSLSFSFVSLQTGFAIGAAVGEAVTTGAAVGGDVTTGADVGEDVGALVGFAVGEAVGPTLCDKVGEEVGAPVTAGGNSTATFEPVDVFLSSSTNVPSSTASAVATAASSIFSIDTGSDFFDEIVMSTVRHSREMSFAAEHATFDADAVTTNALDEANVRTFLLRLMPSFSSNARVAASKSAST